jgi:hypothetical protein
LRSLATSSAPVISFERERQQAYLYHHYTDWYRYIGILSRKFHANHDPGWIDIVLCDGAPPNIEVDPLFDTRFTLTSTRPNTAPAIPQALVIFSPQTRSANQDRISGPYLTRRHIALILFSAMTPAPGSAPCVRYNLPAGLIMTSRELKQYRQWQSSNITRHTTECGLIPTAVEYEDFQQWLKKQDSGYFSDVFDDIQNHVKSAISSSQPAVALLCQHALHPVATEQQQLRCPVCTIDVHLNYMKVLTRSLQCANGRPLPCTGTPSEQQENLYHAWSQGKIGVLQQVSELEDWSAREAEWAEKHTEDLTEDVKSATEALELYWFETSECRNTKHRSTKKKCIAFAEDTKFSPGRPIDYFLRRSPRYTPGKYTVPKDSSDDEEDVSEDSEDYSCARILVVGGSEEPSDDHDLVIAEEVDHTEDVLDALDYDDGDSDWEDIESDEGEWDSSDDSYISFEPDEEASFVVFSQD